MSKVYVYNKNVFPLRELFKGEEVNIAAQDFWRDKNGNKKELDIYEANDYRGQYCPVPFDGSGKMLNDAKYYKMVEIVPVVSSIVTLDAPSPFKCMAKDCKHLSPSPEELEAHTKTRHGNLEKLSIPEEDARLAKKKTA